MKKEELRLVLTELRESLVEFGICKPRMTIANSKLDLEEVKIIVEKIRESALITKLTLSIFVGTVDGNGLCDGSVCEVASLACGDNGLRQLHLRTTACNGLGHNAVSSKGAAAVAEALRLSTTLATLDLSKNRINVKDLCLLRNSTIEELILGRL